MACGCTPAAPSATAMSRSAWSNAASPSPTRRCAIGAARLAMRMPTRYAGAAPGLAIHGTWTKSSSRSTANHGKRHDQCWAVEQEGHILDVLVQRQRDKAAAKTFFRKLLKGSQDVPRAIIIDQLKCDGAATREILPSVEHRPHRSMNNRAENSHQPTRRRERRMQGCKSPGCTQRFLTTYGPIAPHFRPRRYLLPAPNTVKSWEKIRPLAGHHESPHRRIRVTIQAVAHR